MSIFLPSVSVIVPVYNGENDLPKLINCLERQTYPGDRVEYLIVDNNSGDRTSTILEAYVSSTKAIEFQYLKEASIQSSYAARNLAIKNARHELLVFTDADCRPEPEWLTEIVKPFSKSEIGIVVGELLALPGNSLLEKYADRVCLMSPKFLLEHPYCPYGQTANLAIRKEIFHQVGLFRPHLTTGGDADICWRILKQTNWQLEFAPHAIIKHRHRNNLKDFRSQWRRYGTSNRYLNELHGIPLMREFNTQEAIYRLSRWLLKELPIASIKTIVGKVKPIEAIITPLDLIAFQSRSQGQSESQLPEAAREIETFSENFP
jgi:glycosyltransferase involved in cell wall biosynthesis